MGENKRILLTKTFTFDSAHRLEDYEGKCSRLHGHTYRLEVTVCGSRDYRGMVVDFGEMKDIVEKAVIIDFDHCLLNDVMEENPTAENLCAVIWNRLINVFEEKGLQLFRIVLWETPTSCCTIERMD
ncbi:MAG: 6-carboxy-5,6,7,8-tetrahydropterin synthase [Firmicutes bacterium]|nr:6-carboxy-5,6,7,8-tetrahydropterin synthase [Bacillota bacterium]